MYRWNKRANEDTNHTLYIIYPVCIQVETFYDFLCGLVFQVLTSDGDCCWSVACSSVFLIFRSGIKFLSFCITFYSFELNHSRLEESHSNRNTSFILHQIVGTLTGSRYPLLNAGLQADFAAGKKKLYRVAKTHRMPYYHLYRSFPAKEPYS